MARIKGGSNVRKHQREHVAARETLEREYAELLEVDESYAPLVTQEGGREEPFHRWHPYRQAFSPGLVRRFLEEAECVDGPVLDPFSGSGTTIVECARQGRAAIGIDAVPVLAWLARARFSSDASGFPPVPADSALSTWFAAAETVLQKAAVVLAAGRTVSGAGRPKISASPERLVQEVLSMIAEDVQTPLPDLGRTIVGDARLLPLASESCGGLVTSPPYLSRYDYARINAPMERLFHDGGVARLRKRQMRAAVGVKDSHFRRRTKAPLPEAAEEAARGMEQRGNAADAAVVRNYFVDMERTLREARRVLKDGAPCWIVIGCADLEREYVPVDLVCAEQARAAGFRVEGVLEARKLRGSGRRLGAIASMAPRESIVRLRRVAPGFDEDFDA